MGGWMGPQKIMVGPQFRTRCFSASVGKTMAPPADA